MNFDVMQAQLTQARNAVASMKQERERHIRVIALLVSGAGGRAALPMKALAEVPAKFRVDFKGTMAKKEGQPDDSAEEVLMVVVTKLADAATNGEGKKLLVPQTPRIQVP